MPTLAELLQPRRGTLGVLQQQAVAQRPEPVGVLGSAGLDMAAKYGRALQQVGKNYASSLADMFTAPRRAYEGGYDVDESGNITPKFNAPVEANNFAMGLLGMNLPVPNPGGASLGMINAWHGSPHNIPMGRSMLMEKIGTGEGAQAYGHGLYAAENPAVAREYKNVLADRDRANVYRVAAGVKTANNYAAKWQAMLDDPSIQRPLGSKTREPVTDDWLKAQIADENYEAKRLADWVNKRAIDGALYKLELSHPDPLKEAATPLSPNDFLHWDLPLSQQPESVRKALAQIGITHDAKASAAYDDALLGALSGGSTNLPKQVNNPTGGEIYQKLNKKAGSTWLDPNMDASAQISEKLRALGIPGIRYLDGGSRGAGQGTYNYVLFDPKLANIVGKE